MGKVEKYKLHKIHDNWLLGYIQSKTTRTISKITLGNVEKFTEDTMYKIYDTRLNWIIRACKEAGFTYSIKEEWDDFGQPKNPDIITIYCESFGKKYIVFEGNICFATDFMKGVIIFKDLNMVSVGDFTKYDFESTKIEVSNVFSRVVQVTQNVNGITQHIELNKKFLKEIILLYNAMDNL